MKEILLLDREFGAGASTIGERLAARLGWKLFDDALTQEIAQLARIPVDVCRRHEERTDPWLRRLVNVVWKGTFDRNLPSPDLAILDTDRLVALIEQAVRAGGEGEALRHRRTRRSLFPARANRYALRVPVRLA